MEYNDIKETILEIVENKTNDTRKSQEHLEGYYIFDNGGFMIEFMDDHPVSFAFNLEKNTVSLGKIFFTNQNIISFNKEDISEKQLEEFFDLIFVEMGNN